MKKNVVHIFGSGHLVFRLKKIIENDGYTIVQCNDDVINNISVTGSVIENLENYFSNCDLQHIAMIYLLDDKDENNLQLIISLSSLKLNIPIAASLFNENFISTLFRVNNNITIINPAKISAPHFVKAVYKKIDRPREEIPPKKESKEVRKGDRLIPKLILIFAFLALVCTCYFHYFDNFSWVDSIYFVVVTMCTVGYGDLNLLNSTVLSKLVGIFLMLGSTVLMWMIFSLTIDYFLKNRIQIALGRKKYKHKNHIIVCGLGRLGYFIVEELLNIGEKVIIIEISEDSKHIDYFRSRGAEVYIGDAKSEKVLCDVNITQSSALISVISNDALNIEIGLHARTLYPNMKIILRVFDEDIAIEIKNILNIKLALSNSSIASKYFFSVLKDTYSEPSDKK